MTIVEELEYVLGPASVNIFVEIEENYLGNELDVLNAIMTRVDLFERAMISILGNSGRLLFEQALKNALVRIALSR